MTTVVVLQPGYLPWLGFFDQMRRADVFVYYDDVAFDKHGWRNRNRIKSPQGPVWLTVPVLHRARFGQALDEVEIDNRRPWARKHVATIRQLYARAQYLDRYLPELEELLSRSWPGLVELDIAVAQLLAGWLGLQRRLYRASTLGIPGERSQRLLDICRHFRADRYLSGNAAKAYLDTAMFQAAGITVAWQDYTHPVYPQQHGAFEPYLSVLDLLLNVGGESLDVIASGHAAAAGAP